jgi:hypothetical protein
MILSNREIATELNISPIEVNKLLASAMRKINNTLLKNRDMRDNLKECHNLDGRNSHEGDYEYGLPSVMTNEGISLYRRRVSNY